MAMTSRRSLSIIYAISFMIRMAFGHQLLSIFFNWLAGSLIGYHGRPFLKQLVKAVVNATIRSVCSIKCACCATTLSRRAVRWYGS